MFYFLVHVTYRGAVEEGKNRMSVPDTIDGCNNALPLLFSTMHICTVLIPIIQNSPIILYPGNAISLICS